MRLSSLMEKLDEGHYVLRDVFLFLLTVLVGILAWLGQDMKSDIKEQARALVVVEKIVVKQETIQKQQNTTLMEIKDELKQRNRDND